MPRTKRRREWGRGTVFKRGDRGTWSISWRQDGARSYEHAFETEDAAKKRLAVILGDIAAGRKLKPKAGARTLNAYADPWLDARDGTHRSAYDDRNRWDNHLRDTLGRLKPADVTVPVLKGFMARKKTEGLSTSTINLLIRLLSTFFTDLVESGDVDANPCRALSKKTRAVYLRAAHDPKRTPFIESMADVVRIYKALEAKSPTVATAYAIGALAGLRTSEIRALTWEHVDLKALTIHVQVQVERRKGRDPKTWSSEGTSVLKDGESRIVPIQPALAPVLNAWRIVTGPSGLVCPPLRRGKRRFLDDHTMSKFLRDVLDDLSLAKPDLRWYECTRHTMASQYVIAGGSLETLQRIMGHSTVLVTERYAHLRPGHYSIADRNRLEADFGSDSVQLATEMATAGDPTPTRKRTKAA
jgi:integrase